MNGDVQTTGRWSVGMLMGWFGSAVLVASLFATVSLAADTVKVDSLLAHPESYNMKIVRVEGVVRGHRMDHFIGARSKMEKCVQYFLIADESGAIIANYASLCTVGGQDAVILRNGDRVTAEGNFSGAPGAQGVLLVRSVTKQ